MKKIRTLAQFINTLPTLTVEQFAFLEAMNKSNIRGDFTPENTMAFMWGADDVQGVARCSKKMAMEVLHSVHDRHDASIGVNWDVIRCHAESYDLKIRK